MGDLTKNFSRSEFACRCCGKNNIKSGLVSKLQKARTASGVPFIINSGVRCKKKNNTIKKKRKSVSNSAHLTGEAADIKCTNSLDRQKIEIALYKAGIKRVGLNKTFIHADISKTKPQKRTWLY